MDSKKDEAPLFPPSADGGTKGGEIHSYCMYMKHPSSQRDLSGEISPPQAEDFTLSKNRIQ